MAEIDDNYHHNRTVDNLGIAPHREYAKRESLRGVSSDTESFAVHRYASYDSLSPLTSDELDILFQTSTRNIPWGTFPKPKEFDYQQSRIFTYQLAPSLGTEERVELCLNRLEEVMKKIEMEPNDANRSKLLNEANTLKTLLSKLINLNQMLEEATKKRRQFTKG